MDSRHGNNCCRGSGLHIVLGNDEEYEESEVWEVLDNQGGSTEGSPAFYHEDDQPRAPILRKNRVSAVSGIPKPRPSLGASRVQKSAPVNITYLGKDSTGMLSSSRKTKESCDDSDVDEKERESDEEEGEEGGYGDCELPPHEFIAKRLARSHIWSFSVLEGAGRKLKGRDLSKVRHAVLTKTGFLDPPSNLDSN